MGLFGGNTTTYKGYDIVKDPESGLYYIRKSGRYGTSLGTADSVKAAKDKIDKEG